MGDISKHTKAENIYSQDYVIGHKAYEALDIDKNRFVKFEERETRSVLTLDMMKVLCHGKYQTSWNGVEVLKTSVDLITLQDLICREKPATIIEFGSYSGGCALWFADLVKCFGIHSHIYSVDISFGCLHEKVKKREDITFIKADLSKEMEKAFPEKMLKQLPHPWFISEDCHVPLQKTIGYLEPFMKPGDYLLVEDTHPSAPTHVGQGLYMDGYTEVGYEKLNHLREFLNNYKDKFLVDSHYTDFFGYNGSSNINSYLKRV